MKTLRNYVIHKTKKKSLSGLTVATEPGLQRPHPSKIWLDCDALWTGDSDSDWFDFLSLLHPVTTLRRRRIQWRLDQRDLTPSGCITDGGIASFHDYVTKRKKAEETMVMLGQRVKYYLWLLKLDPYIRHNPHSNASMCAIGGSKHTRVSHTWLTQLHNSEVQ